MRTGHPSRSETDALLGRVQLIYLRQTLCLDDQALKSWLLHMDCTIGGFLPRDASAIVSGRQTMSLGKATALDHYVPGLLEITEWPWLCLDSIRREGKYIRRRLERLGKPCQRPHSDARPSWNRDVVFHGVAGREAWVLAREFFYDLLVFRRLQSEGDELGLGTFGSRLIASLERALNHPTIAAVEPDIYSFVEAAIKTSPLADLLSAIGQSQYRHRRRESGSSQDGRVM